MAYPAYDAYGQGPVAFPMSRRQSMAYTDGYVDPPIVAGGAYPEVRQHASHSRRSRTSVKRMWRTYPPISGDERRSAAKRSRRGGCTRTQSTTMTEWKMKGRIMVRKVLQAKEVECRSSRRRAARIWPATASMISGGKVSRVGHAFLGLVAMAVEGELSTVDVVMVRREEMAHLKMPSRTLGIERLQAGSCGIGGGPFVRFM